MEFVPLPQKRDQETRVENQQAHFPKSFMYFGFVDISAGPSLMMPQRFFTRSKAVSCRVSRRCLRERSSASRTRADLGINLRAASASSCSFNSSGILQVIVAIA